MSRKGQAALEFLTTYGWALLIIMVMIGAISYFGILNPSKFIPTRCAVSPEFSCIDYQIKSSDNKVYLDMKQGVGKTIYLQRIDCKYGTLTATSPGNNAQWNPTAKQILTCQFPANTFTNAGGQKVKVTYEIVYTKSATSTLTQVATGEVFAEVQ